MQESPSHLKSQRLDTCRNSFPKSKKTQVSREPILLRSNTTQERLTVLKGWSSTEAKAGDPTVPPDKSYYYEFHYDSEGKLSHLVENNKGVSALSALFYCDGTNPTARICFVQGKYSYSDLAFYNKNGMYFKCRIAPDGKVLSKWAYCYGAAIVGGRVVSGSACKLEK